MDIFTMIDLIYARKLAETAMMHNRPARRELGEVLIEALDLIEGLETSGPVDLDNYPFNQLYSTRTGRS